MNGGQIQPTVELATTNGGNGFYPYPVYPMMGGNGNNSGFGGDGWWVLILIALLGGFGNGNGWGGGFGGNNNDFAWLSNGQKDIMNNTSDGFNSLHISSQIEGVRDGVNNLATQLCGSTADVVSAVNNGFSSAEISANARQIADMNQNFNNQIATLQGFNGLQSQLAQCCCDNRLAIANLGSDIAREACADRQAVTDGVRDIIANQTASVQTVLNKLCQLELDNYKRENDNLRTQVNMQNLAASQAAQNTYLIDQLKPCPIPAYITCNPYQSLNTGCGCNGTGNFI